MSARLSRGWCYEEKEAPRSAQTPSGKAPGSGGERAPLRGVRRQQGLGEKAAVCEPKVVLAKNQPGSLLILDVRPPSLWARERLLLTPARQATAALGAPSLNEQVCDRPPVYDPEGLGAPCHLSGPGCFLTVGRGFVVCLSGRRDTRLYPTELFYLSLLPLP